MASESTSYREDVEQARRRFGEFRQTYAARRGYRVVGDGGEAGAAGWDNRYGAGAGCGPTESSKVDRSIGASRFQGRYCRRREIRRCGVRRKKRYLTVCSNSITI